MITLDGTTTVATDAATKAYVDLKTTFGLDPKDPALVVATSNSAISGLLTIDGVTLVANDRVLLVGQTNEVENGLWLANSGSWTRPTDFATGEIAGTAYVLITSGDTNTGTSWVCDTPAAVIDTDELTFVQFSLSEDGANVGTGTGQVFLDKTESTLNL